MEPLNMCHQFPWNKKHDVIKPWSRWTRANSSSGTEKWRHKNHEGIERMPPVPLEQKNDVIERELPVCLEVLEE